ncbi:hypothetical protein EXS70_01695 [Candidatus Peribacteria bacterium]|nr:hypothetical protein [Candidatus Peribacteria bacterium]
MGNAPLINVEGFESRLHSLEELCKQVPFDLKAATLGHKKLYLELVGLHNDVITLMHIASRGEEERRKAAEPKTKKQAPPLTEIPISTSGDRVGYSWSPALNYTTPTNPQELKELLGKTFGASNKPMEFDDLLLEQGMKNAHLENRGEWAVYLSLLASPTGLMRENELEVSTGYSFGSVCGCLHRLEKLSLARQVDNDLWSVEKTI